MHVQEPSLGFAKVYRIKWKKSYYAFLESFTVVSVVRVVSVRPFENWQAVLRG